MGKSLYHIFQDMRSISSYQAFFQIDEENQDN